MYSSRSQDGQNPNIHGYPIQVDAHQPEGPHPGQELSPPERVVRGSRHSLGRAVLEAHGIIPGNHRVAICNSYVTGPFENDSVAVNLLPDPRGDAYLHFTAVPTLSSGEVLLSFKLQPGMREYYERIGLLPADAEVIEVNPDKRLTEKPGYPYTDPMAQFRAQGQRINATYFVATFPSITARCNAGQLGCLSVQNFDPAYLNNKAQFRDDSERYSYKVLPGLTLNAVSDLERVLQLPHGKCWIKLACGSGGDLVRCFENTGKENLLSAIDSIRAAVVSAFQAADFPPGSSLQDFWPEDSLLPRAAKLVVEQDARSLGPELINGSMNVLLKRDGSFELVDFFKQNTAPNGSYRGSERFEPETISAGLHQAILGQAKNVFAYAHQMGLRGYLGFDFFALGTPQDPSIFCIELNARPTMSAVPALTAKKLLSIDRERHAQYINVNIRASELLLSFEDFRKSFTLDGNDLTDPQNPSGVTVVPLALRSIFEEHKAEYNCLVPSAQAKILVTAASTDAAWHMLHRLEQAGQISLGD